MFRLFTLLLLWRARLASADNTSSLVEQEVRLLYLVSSFGLPQNLNIRSMELAAALLERQWASEDAAASTNVSRKLRVHVVRVGDKVGEAGVAIQSAIEAIEPCWLSGVISASAEINYAAAHAAMYNNLLFTPLRDDTARTIIDQGSFNLTVNMVGAALGSGTFLAPFAEFMRFFGWKRAVVLLDASAASLIRELCSLTHGLDIALQFLATDSLDYPADFNRILDFIQDGHYSIIAISLPSVSESRDRALLQMAADRGFFKAGYQWCANVAPWSIKLAEYEFEGIFGFQPAMYEFDEADPGAWPGSPLGEIADSVQDALWSLLTMTQPERVICHEPTACMSNFEPPSHYGEALLMGGTVYALGQIASSLAAHELCGSAQSRTSASNEKLLKVAQAEEIHLQVALGRIQLVPAAAGLSRASSTLVTTKARYDTSKDIPFASLIEQLDLPRSFGVIGREGQVRLIDGWLNIPASEFEEHNLEPILFMGGAVDPPLDYIPDSCGNKAAVNGSGCIACQYGFALPMDGTNLCLPAAEPCKEGYAWNFQQILCEACKPGTFATDGICEACPTGRSSTTGQGSCSLCAEGYYRSAGMDDCVFCFDPATGKDAWVHYRVQDSECVLSFSYHYCFLSLLAFVAFFSLIFGALRFDTFPLVRGRQVHIEDISLKRGHVVITVLGWHYLNPALQQMFKRPMLQLKFHGTGHRQLDEAPTHFRGKILSGDRIQLCGCDGAPITERLDASQGTLDLTVFQSLLMTGLILPILLQALLWLAIGVVIGVYLSHVERVFSWGVGAIAGTIIGRQWKRKRMKTTLERALDSYTNSVAFPLKRVPRGPDRAISIGQVSELYEAFQGVIRDRNMYYLKPNILHHITKPHRLSFAEVVGPQRVQWFVSHWWGHEFGVTVSSILKHAMHPNVCQGIDWKNISYWICTFSNNQFEIGEEIGEDETSSSFYLALWSDTCLGTCLILDERAHPLKRSWCLFEFLQTMRLERSNASPQFQGLLFCTDSGVLNYGKASVETSLRIGACLATLCLQDATASAAQDKQMIDSIVQRDFGGFAAVNEQLRAHIGCALAVAKSASDAEFANLFETLPPLPHAGTPASFDEVEL